MCVGALIPWSESQDNHVQREEMGILHDYYRLRMSPRDSDTLGQSPARALRCSVFDLGKKDTGIQLRLSPLPIRPPKYPLMEVVARFVFECV